MPRRCGTRRFRYFHQLRQCIDPSNVGRRGLFQPDVEIPGSSAADDNNYVTAARTLWSVPAAGLYTVMIRADDIAAMRITGAFWNGKLPEEMDISIPTIPTPSGITSAVATPTSAPSSTSRPPATISWNLSRRKPPAGPNMEVFYAAGVHFLDQDTNWTLIGNPADSVPPLPAVIANSTGSTGSTWGLHVARETGFQLTSLGGVIDMLQSTSEFTEHFRSQTPVLNHHEPDYGGTGGLFGGNLPVPGEVPGTNDDDFALHARSRLEITQGGVYTFAVRFSDMTFLRIKAAGAATWLPWSGVNNDFSFDVTDRTVVGWLS